MSSYIPAFQPKTVVTQAEKDELLAYLRAVVNPGAELTLSQLRKPGSRLSLQSLEVIASACVADGSLLVQYKQNGKGNASYAMYSLTGS